MFTVRVNFGGENRHVFQCERYEVLKNGGSAVRLTMYGVPGITDDGKELTLDGDQVAYVMNELGNSVDCVRPCKSLRAVNG